MQRHSLTGLDAWLVAWSGKLVTHICSESIIHLYEFIEFSR